jgi:membrane peptidoglycan carboxypeptidase
MKHRHALRRAAWFAAAALALLFVIALLSTVYYVREVQLARRDTPALVAAAWKRYGSAVSPANLSDQRLSVLLAVEDPTFPWHRGVDLTTPGAGMTTITQGLVKLLYFPRGFKQGIAKIRQTLIAEYALDPLVSKEDQIGLFLNGCYMGSEQGKSVYGYANAARAYFGKGLSALADDEFESLVAMHIEPDALKPGTAANLERVRRIQSYLSGRYTPVDLLDVGYGGNRHGSLAEWALIRFLRVVTSSPPPHASAAWPCRLTRACSGRAGAADTGWRVHLK